MKKFLSPADQKELNQLIIKNIDRNIVFLSGGTDLLVQKTEFDRADVVINLMNLQDFNKIFVKDDILFIGSTATINKIIKNEHIKRNFPLLTETARQVGSPQIKNRATPGGNFANASPAGDTIPALSVAEARIRIFNTNKEAIQLIPVNEFFLDPGKTILKNGDYISGFEISVNSIQNYKYAFHKVGQRKALAISKLSVACLCQRTINQINDIRFAVGSVAPTVRRLVETENYLKRKKAPFDYQKISQIVESEIDPITDVRSNRDFRKQVTAKLVIKCLKELI